MSRTRTAARTVAPRHPRRVSGPVTTRPRAVPGRPRPSTPVVAPPTLADHLRALPDARLLDRLLRSRAWIWLLGIALGGIVAMQVSLLGMNSGISKSVQTATDLERGNLLLQTEIARLQNAERINAAAANTGLASPDPGDVSILKARRKRDPDRVTLTPASAEAKANLAAGGVPAGATLAPTETTAATTTTATTDPATTTTTTDPAATATTDPAAATTTTTTDPAAVATAAPVATTAPVATADPTTTTAAVAP